ncbi:MAG: MFS transporter [Planctomycetota bacterium]|nr:MAG: MFS transporter [Planctomycetota bacterium]
MRTTTPRLVFTLCVLLGINTMNFFDRQVLPAVQEKIRKEWQLSDSELGGLGTAFILLYAVVGLPLGRLADVWRRRWILAAGVGLWSLLTLGSGFAWSFWSLLVLRLGVGIGEASCAPTAASLIGDLVPAERRARALAVFMLGLPLGLAASFFVSSTIAERRSWQAAFYVAGLPGLLLAVAALFIADPVRGGADPHADAASSPGPGAPGFGAALRRVLGLPTMWWIIASGALHNFNMYALGTFLPSLLKRYHQVSVERAGHMSGVVYGFGALGIFAAGWLGDRVFHRGVSGRLHVAWIGLAAAIPCLLLALAVPEGQIEWCAVWLMPACMLLYVYYGTVYATIQDIIEPSLRGLAMSIYFCAMYLLGAVLGPVATGWASDHFARRAAAAAGSTTVTEVHRAVGLHDAMYLIPILDAALVAVLFTAAQTVKGDYLRLRARLEAATSADT